MCHVFRLEHFRGIFAGVRAEVGVGRTRTDHAHADVVAAQFLGYGVAQAVQSPLGGCVGRAIRQRIFPGERGDIDDVARAGANHHRGKRANAVVNTAQIRI